MPEYPIGEGRNPRHTRSATPRPPYQSSEVVAASVRICRRLLYRLWPANNGGRLRRTEPGHRLLLSPADKRLRPFRLEGAQPRLVSIVAKRSLRLDPLRSDCAPTFGWLMRVKIKSPSRRSSVDLAGPPCISVSSRALGALELVTIEA